MTEQCKVIEYRYSKRFGRSIPVITRIESEPFSYEELKAILYAAFMADIANSSK